MFDTPLTLEPREYDVIPAVPAIHDFGADALLRKFHRRFEIVAADTPARIRQAQRIRYQVYCIENALEPLANPEGMETDEFDSHAVHTLLLSRETGDVLGTVRLILPLAHARESSFAVQRLLDRDALSELGTLPLHSTAEISRFSISRHFRRRAMGEGVAEDHTDAMLMSNSGALMRLGLMQAIMRMSIEQGITDWCALMEPTLLRMLAAMAIRFRAIGPLVEFRGMRQPCRLNVSDMLNAVSRERPRFYDLITDGGSLGMCAAAA